MFFLSVVNFIYKGDDNKHPERVNLTWHSMKIYITFEHEKKL